MLILFTALGISDEVELYGLKGNKKKKGKKLDEDYMVHPSAFFISSLNIVQPILKPLVEKDVPKVIQAVRQTQSRKVKLKVLTRIKVCSVLIHRWMMIQCLLIVD